MMEYPDTIRCSRPKADGFTIVELLVGLALIALVSIYLSQAMSFGRRAWETADKLDRTVGLENIQKLLRERISRAHWPAAADDQSGTRHLFEGKERKMSFSATLPGTTQAAGNYLVEILADPNASAGKETMSLTLRQVFLGRPNEESTSIRDSEHRLLFSGADRIKFRYFGAQTPGTAKSWTGTWERGDSLPDLIAIDASFSPTDSRHWAEFIVATRIRN